MNVVCTQKTFQGSFLRHWEHLLLVVFHQLSKPTSKSSSLLSFWSKFAFLIEKLWLKHKFHWELLCKQKYENHAFFNYNVYSVCYNYGDGVTNSIPTKIKSSIPTIDTRAIQGLTQTAHVSMSNCFHSFNSYFEIKSGVKVKVWKLHGKKYDRVLMFN